MRTPTRRLSLPRAGGNPSNDAFSLVEVTIAIGIFAFVIVGIMGLFPAALKQRSDAALETRAVMAAQQVFAGINGSSSTNAIFLPPTKDQADQLPSKSISSFPWVLQFGTTNTSALRIVDGGAWSNTATEVDADALARVKIQAEPGAPAGLYRATVDYGRPASLSESKRRNFSFTKLVYLP